MNVGIECHNEDNYVKSYDLFHVNYCGPLRDPYPNRGLVLFTTYRILANLAARLWHYPG